MGRHIGRDEDGSKNTDEIGDVEEVRAARERWSVKLPAMQREPRSQLGGSAVSREEMTALVKEARSNSVG